MVKIWLLALSIFFFPLKAQEETLFMKEDPVVIIETNMGTVKVKLWPHVAPKACKNFAKLAEDGYYDGVIFHRTIKNFMIQGGDPTGTGTGGASIWQKPFEDEVETAITFDRPGLLAMANSGPTTNGSQFFITTIATPWLNMSHTIFGEVIGGMDIVEKISMVKTTDGDRPAVEQKIVKMRVKK